MQKSPSATRFENLVHKLLPHTARSRRDVLRTNFPWEATRDMLMNYFFIFHAIRVRGLNNIPHHGPVIFAPNHVSYYDPPLIGACIPFRVRTMAWEALFRVPILKALILMYGAFPVKLKSADRTAYAESLRILRNRECLIVFPEGERAKTGQLGPLEHGVARVAMQTGSAIVPVTITGAFEAYSRFKVLPRWFRPIEVKFHPALQVDATSNREEVRERIPKINEAIAGPIRRRLAAYARLCERRRR